MTHAKKRSRRGPWFAIVATATATCAMSVFSAPAFAGGAATSQQLATAPRTTATATRTMTVSGVGEVMVKPDSIRTNISIKARAKTLELARTEVATKTQAVIKALEALKLQALQIRTVEITVTPITEREKQPNDQTPPQIIGYEAVSRLSVALKGVEPDSLRVDGPRILGAALAAGANAVGGIDFFLSKPREAHRLALAAAVQDAEKNAKAMASAATVKMLGLQTLSGEGGLVYEFAQKAVYGGPEDEGEGEGFPVEPGEIRVTANVTATFQFTK